MWTLSSYFPSPKSVQNLFREKMALLSTLVDKLSTISGFACPISVRVFRNLTEVWQSLDCTWTVTWRTPYMTCFWTVLGRGLDRGWTNIGFSVQNLSNQPKLTSTGGGLLHTINILECKKYNFASAHPIRCDSCHLLEFPIWLGF